MFRASPWITYDPPASDSQPSQPMDNDTEMDAPQISTLPDEGESPASPARTSKFRVKLVVKEANMGTKFINFNGETGEEAGVAEEDEPDDDEEDELIDDEADASTPGTSSAKSGTKRPSTKLKSSQARRKARLNAPNSAPSASSPALASSSETQGSPAKDVQDAPLPSIELPPSTAPETTLAVSAPPSKRKVVPKGTTPAQRAPRKSAPK